MSLPVALAILGAVFPLAAGAQRAGDPAVPGTGQADRETVRLALSVSGAISVGSYQAGVNWALLEFLRRANADSTFLRRERPSGLPRFELRAVTGASAGNVNTLLWALEWCTSDTGGTPVANSHDGSRYAAADPAASLFWRTWIGIGIESMLPDDRYDPKTMDRAILNRRTVRRITDPPLFERLRDARLVEGCELPVGITLTRTRPDIIDFSGLAIETQRFATLFRARVVTSAEVEADGDRLHFLQLPTRPESESHFGKLVRLLPPQGRIPTSEVLSAVQASAAFPVALAPVALHVYQARPDSGGTSSSSVFIDGGVFDNNPIHLTLGLYRHAGAPGPAHVVYVNPFRYRGALERARQTEFERPPAVGGLAVVGEFLGGAVATARQYELQVLARQRQASNEAVTRYDSLLGANLSAGIRGVRWRDAAVAGVLTDLVDSARARAATEVREHRDSLAFTSRAYPIYGEHLHGFAGFLGRPFREFDFYVGAYDGYHFAARELVCASEPVDRVDACTRWVLASMMSDERLVPPVARRLLATLHDGEHYPDRITEGRQALSASVSPPADMDDLRKDRILLALYRAAGTQFANEGDAECERVGDLIQRVLCRDGLSGIVAHLRADVERHPAYVSTGSVEEILRGWSADCERQPPEDCLASRDFIDLVFHQRVHASRLIERVLDRLEAVERSLKDQGQPHYTSSVTILNALYHTTHLRSRGRFETSPSRPKGVRPASNLLPYSIGGPMGRSGWELRARPTFNRVDSRWALSVPISWIRDAERRMTHGAGNALGIGAGVIRRAPMPSVVIFMPETGLEWHVLTPLGSGDRGTWSAAELYATFIGGFFRLSVRADASRSASAPYHISGNVALADIGGLAYWVVRSTGSR